MKKILMILIAAGMLGSLWASSAAARPENDGNFQRGLTEWFGGIGRDLESTGKGFSKVFLERLDTD